MADVAPTAISNISDLRARAIPSSPPAYVVTMGYHSAGDGAGEVYAWSSDVTSADNAGSVIVPNSLPRYGCWKTLSDSAISVRGFGAKGAPYDDTTVLQAAIDAANAAGKDLYADRGVYRFSTLVWPGNTRIVGAGSGLVNAKGTVFRKFGTGPGITLEQVSQVQNISAAHIAFEQEDSSCGDVIDFAGVTHVHNFHLDHVSAALKNPATRFLKAITSSVCKSRIKDIELQAAENASVSAIDIRCPAGSNMFQFVIDGAGVGTYVSESGGISSNSVPLILVADDGGAVSFGVVFKNITGEPGPGGLIEARGMFTGPLFDNVTSSDCQDAWPIIKISKGTGSAYGYGAATFQSCFLHNITCEAISGCRSPVILGGYVQRLDAQGALRPRAVGADIRILEGTTTCEIL